MIEALTSDEIIQRAGGRYRLAALIQKRWLEIVQGAHPMVDRAGLTDMEVVVQEILEGKVEIDNEASGLEPPPPQQ